ncbi:hypothetical protein M427DRAFT_35630 [Gonapodya prolifera JEL478]|uniref:RNA recognition motif domain-containing protein n=1 Tax=Gonapodya prolifera (strain JEL478) TaxID=1344416 RepID=A0A139A4F0_GONPJ|nr:hypothetical protein M427DRAFT_35630 [Gonapodya prolifera JEL478]|eukprot:KXS11671.1 hypothetical protein M427DRAFT_35630 [Gonapodya prolifera JEL478]
MDLKKPISGAWSASTSFLEQAVKRKKAEVKRPPPSRPTASLLPSFQPLPATSRDVNENPQTSAIPQPSFPPASIFTTSPTVSDIPREKGGKRKRGKKVPQFQVDEEYDPARPNDFDTMKMEYRRRKEEEKQRLLAEALRGPGTASPTSVAVDAESGEEAFLRRGRLSQPEAPYNAIDLDVSGEDAYLRRGQLSFGGAPPESHDGATATTVVLLKNMVGPGQVDDHLHEDVAEEAEKFGKVERCLVFEVPGGNTPPEEAVRVFVKFSNLDGAKKAKAAFDGRFFGGRPVSATYYPVRKFDALDLAPSEDET